MHSAHSGQAPTSNDVVLMHFRGPCLFRVFSESPGANTVALSGKPLGGGCAYSCSSVELLHGASVCASCVQSYCCMQVSGGYRQLFVWVSEVVQGEAYSAAAVFFIHLEVAALAIQDYFCVLL